ncbi:uncharacterized protein LOC118739423 [Rhagoletis pomonella]|uniref:uncharacterized protein LOC118739423 n=1 Tax=Rhagoletis pomonella TaxID=28610 RepID=UPI001782733F|nr:uncharacterized protein LOC118739423 [Rhagoletis pomonella]
MVRIRGERCAISSDGHLLDGEGVVISNPKLLEFARKRKVDFRKESLVCAKCAISLEKIYEYKIRCAIEKKNQLKSLAISSSSSLDDFDRLVYRTPRTKHLRGIVKENAPFQLRGPSQDIINVGEDKENRDNNVRGEDLAASASLIVSDDSSVVLEPSNVPISLATYEVLPMSRDSSQNSSLDVRPSTSETAAAARAAKQNDKHTETIAWRKPVEPVKRKRVHFEYDQSGHLTAASTDDDDDNDDFTPSLNALNGTRLPHVQPIPKRRQFQHVIPTVQDIYMQGITGG